MSTKGSIKGILRYVSFVSFFYDSIEGIKDRRHRVAADLRYSCLSDNLLLCWIEYILCMVR